MTMTPEVRKLALTAHVTVSVGWIGAVLCYVVVVIAAMTSADDYALRSAWAVFELLGWYVIVPLAFASLLSGLLMSLGTHWGLVRHYWTMLSFALTAIAIVVLVRHMVTVSAFADLAAEGGPADASNLREALRGELLHGGIGLLILLAIEAINIYKPRGTTPFARREGTATDLSPVPNEGGVRFPAGGVLAGVPFWARVIAFHALGIGTVLVIVHFARAFPHQQ